ncbi:hypothetical protein KR067_009812 [Drosophila pandora]|nr:hypothetical protein KR067_009812 [Drosophila pandora]
MEVHTVEMNNLHCSTAVLSPIQSAPVATKAAPNKTVIKNSTIDTDFLGKLNHQNDNRNCDSPGSSNSELEKECNVIKNLNCSLTGSESLEKSCGSLSGASSITSAFQGSNTVEPGKINGPVSGDCSGGVVSASVHIKKRISSSRTPTRKAHRIKFYRNGDRFYPGITIPVSNDRYRSFESLYEDLTRLLEENVKIPGAVRTIYSMCGKKITAMDEFEDGQSYVCSCNNENFKKVDYNNSSQTLANLTLATNGRYNNQRSTKQQRPASPLKNVSGINSAPLFFVNSANGGLLNTAKISERDRVVYPRIVTLIRNGTKPRRIMRLLLNKRNSPSFDHVLTAITQVVRLDTGYVRKVFTLGGASVSQLADFFGPDDVFFAYGTERINTAEDFKLEAEEQRCINAIRKTLRTAGTTCKGPKPKMPVKSKNVYPPLIEPDIKEPHISLGEEQAELHKSTEIEFHDLPSGIRENYDIGGIIGDGNFAIVLKIKHRETNKAYALKIIDKSKCKGKEHYIDAEVRVMKKLDHPHIISLIMDVDQETNMYLVLEYVSGGDLFDAITQVTRFSERQSRIMIRHLGSAMSYLHSLGIVHRDIKPENLLVELDEHGNVFELKLADFGLACEVTEPLYAVCGTPTYVAPEILLEVGYGLKIDVWAAGIILYILLCGFPPFVAPDNQQEPLFDAIISGVYEFPDPYWSDIGDGVRDLIANMLQSDPSVRFTSEDILDHYWTMNNENSCSDFSR